MNKIKKGDEVIIMTGKDKGRRGQVLKVFRSSKILVENINLVKKHQKGNPNTGQESGIIEKEMPIQSSNVMLFNPATGKGDRVGFTTLEDGRKVRLFRSNSEVVDMVNLVELTICGVSQIVKIVGIELKDTLECLKRQVYGILMKELCKYN